jgi:molybdate transport system substrate-binding protein
LAVTGTRFTYATGRLVMWSVTPNLFPGGEAYLKSLAFSRIAIANPGTAPYGTAAREVLQHLGVWEQARPRLVQGENVGQTFQFTATGNADVGFVALSQVISWPGEPGTVWEIPPDYCRPINQQAVLLKNGADNPAARAFLDFLGSTEARELIAGYGYGVE